MLHPLKPILGYTVQATDKPAGKVNDLLFDDVTWNIRHVVVGDPGGIGIQPASVDPANVAGVDNGASRMNMKLTQAEIAGGPDVSLDPPVSRSHTSASDPTLRSLDEVVGYKVVASDGEVGTIADLLAGDNDWKVHLVAVQSAGGPVLVGAGLIDRFDPDNHSAHVELDKAGFAASPAYDASKPPASIDDVKLVGQKGV